MKPRQTSPQANKSNRKRSPKQASPRKEKFEIVVTEARLVEIWATNHDEAFARAIAGEGQTRKINRDAKMEAWITPD